ncbi:EspA/EspE family type VII secretion system effector [Mycolicibacterium goodii]|uniref:TPR repeat region-containing protein n=1 Tax=Mycolicibacterium goodii TaxID=134601 RepID=UPI0018EB7671|nr:EspA/EspE family type VII secretion system effector [Mycolicibacterium goodii]
MGALDGFYSTWNKARETFGQGVPTDGSQFDHSSELLNMKASVEAAAPDDRWQGSGANAYAAANKEHAQVYEKLADLDRKMAAEVKNAANVVSVGRTNLDTAKGWVESMVNSLPATSEQDRERKLIPIAREGINKVDNIVKSATDEMRTIQGRVTGYKGEFEELSNQKFAPGGEKPGDKKDDPQKLKEEEKDDTPGMQPPSPEYQAQKDVEAVLSEGDGSAAERTDRILSSIKPGEKLTPEQDAYLTEMQRQQKGMSVEDLAAAERRLGDHKNIIADSWQLMSNDDVEYTGGAGDEKKGSASQLPDSVQKTLSKAGDTWPLTENTGQLRYEEDLKAISQIVKDGNPYFQTGTELDRQLIVAADRAMDAQSTMVPIVGMESTVQSLFEAVDDDHQIINDHLMGRNGVDVDDFLHDVNTIDWPDNGKAAGYLFSWTGEPSTGHEQLIASQTAEKYANYIGNHPELMGVNGQTLGQLNPELVQGYARGLTPYIPDIAGLSTAQKDGDAFNFLDTTEPVDRPIAKTIFSVLSTDPDAYNTFHTAIDQQIISASHAWAQDVKDGVPVQPNDARLLDAQTLKGLAEVGTAEAAKAPGVNAAQMYEQHKSAYEDAVNLLSAGASVVPTYGQVAGPGIQTFGILMQDAILGDPPKAEEFTITPPTEGDSARFALNALLAEEVPLIDNTNGQFNPQDYFTPVDPADPSRGYKPTILDTTGLVENGISPNSAEEVLTQVIRDTLGSSDPTDAMYHRFEEVTKNPVPNPAKKPGE